MKPHRTISRAYPAMLLLLCVAAGPAFADGEATFGTQWWDQTAREAKYQEFGDYPNGLYLESFLLRDELWGGRYAIVGTKALRNDQSTEGTYRRPRWTLSLGYGRTPHNFSFVTRTPYGVIAPGRLALPDTLQQANQNASNAGYTASMSNLMNSANREPLGFRTDLSKARLKARLGRGVSLDVKASRRQRNGDKAYGGSFGFSNVTEIMEPIRQVMNEGEAKLSYAHKRLALEAVAGMSAFHNRVDALEWDNPRRAVNSATAGSSVGALDLYPDNRTLRGGLSASLNLKHRTNLLAAVHVSETTQDDEWLPYTRNPAIVIADSIAIEGTNTEGKLRTFTQDYRITTRPSSYWSGTLRFRRNEMKNETETHRFGAQVAYDQSLQVGEVRSHPFGNTNTTFGGDVSVTPTARITLSGTAERVRVDRTFREIARTDEDVLAAKVRIRPRSGLELTGAYRRGDRSHDEFEYEDYQNEAGVFIEQPGLRRFDVADRVQNRATAGLGWSPTERVEVSGSFEYLRNEYGDEDLADADSTQFGLLDESRHSASVEALFHLSPKLDLSGGYGWGQIYTNQRSRQSSSAAISTSDNDNWQARLKDWFIYANGTLEWRPVPERWTFRGRYEFDRQPGIFRLTNGPGTAVDLPSTKYRRQSVGAEAWYRVDKHFEIGGRWMWEEFTVKDFAAEDIPYVFPLAGSTTAIFMGDSIRDYKAHQLGLAVRRSW